MSIQLPASVHSLEQLSKLLFEIENRLGQQQDQRAQKHLMNQIVTQASPASTALQETARLNNLDVDNGDTMRELHKALRDLRSSAPQLKLTLAGWPDASVKEQLTEWFRANIHPFALLTFIVRSDICGGVIIQTPRRRMDLSYRQLLIDNRHKLAELAFHGT